MTNSNGMSKKQWTAAKHFKLNGLSNLYHSIIWFWPWVSSTNFPDPSHKKDLLKQTMDDIDSLNAHGGWTTVLRRGQTAQPTETSFEPLSKFHFWGRVCCCGEGGGCGVPMRGEMLLNFKKKISALFRLRSNGSSTWRLIPPQEVPLYPEVGDKISFHSIQHLSGWNQFGSL